MKSAPRRMFVRAVVALAVAVSSLAVSATPARAAGVSNNIRWGESSTVQWLTESYTCWGVTESYTQKIEWNYQTNIDSLSIFWVRMTFWNHTTRDLTRGSKGIVSGNSFWQLYPTHETIGQGFAYERTWTIGRGFLWQNNRYITLRVNVGRPCGGYNESAFQLVKAYN